MATVVLSSDTELVVATDICVKTGVKTTDRVRLRGSTTPPWVTLLLLLTIIGWLLANAKTSRSYDIEVPFVHERHERWRLLKRVGWALNLGGVLAALWASRPELLWVSVVGLVVGLVNALLNNVGIHQRDNGELLLTRVHRDAAAAMTRPYDDSPAGQALSS